MRRIDNLIAGDTYIAELMPAVTRYYREARIIRRVEKAAAFGLAVVLIGAMLLLA